ncbi:MAG TPA: hypothetical protein GXZ82_00180 [Firmicutes bacterium]|nr:hypothetical protein [Bacillota bacterium]
MENESIREILTCIRQLPETLRTMVYFRYVEDLTVQQISLLTNLRMSTSIFHTSNLLLSEQPPKAASTPGSHYQRSRPSPQATAVRSLLLEKE